MQCAVGTQRGEAGQRHGACPDGVLLITRTFAWGQLAGEEHELARGEVLEWVEFAEEDQLVGVPAKFFLKFTVGGLLEWLARFDGPAGQYQHLAVKGHGTLEG